MDHTRIWAATVAVKSSLKNSGIFDVMESLEIVSENKIRLKVAQKLSWKLRLNEKRGCHKIINRPETIKTLKVGKDLP